MNTVVLLKMVPDVVEELDVATDGCSLNAEFLRMILNERDAHALEQALLLKELHGGKVTALALDVAEADDALFTALAKGVDRAVKVTGFEPGLSTRSAAQTLAQVLTALPGVLPVDLILTGCQAIDDLDGMLAPLLAHEMKLPYLGLVTHVALEAADHKATVRKEYAGGVHGEFEVQLPAVLGIQAAEKPPRYVPVAKVRAVMKSQKIELAEAPAPGSGGEAGYRVLAMAKPMAAGHAKMLEGTPEEIASKIAEVLVARGVL